MQPLVQGAIAIEGPARSGKTALLIRRAIDLLKTEPSQSVLILCSNYYRKSQFLEAIQTELRGGYAQLQVFTYASLVRQTLSVYWPHIESLIVDSQLAGMPVIFPELSGFEASEYIVRKIVGTIRARDENAFSEFIGSERSLITQIIRRIRLRAENRLERKEMRRRSELIGETCLADVDLVLREFDRWSLRLRVFDNSKQIDAFHTLLDRNPDVQAFFHSRIRHLIVDDVDETIPAQQHFIRFIAPALKTLAIAADIDGGTRRGYLNAYPYDWSALKALRPDMETRVLERPDRFYTLAGSLLDNWTRPDPNVLPESLPIGENREIQWRPQTLTRLDMISDVVSDITALLRDNPAESSVQAVSPGDIVIVMPKVDVLARLQLQQQFRSRGIPFQILTGTTRPSDSPACRSLLMLLQLVNQVAWQMPVSPLEFKGILRDALKLHVLDPAGLEVLVQTYRETLGAQPLFGLPPSNLLNPIAAERYETLLGWLDRYREESLEEQLYTAFSRIISPQLTPEDELASIHQLTRSLYIQRLAQEFEGTAADADSGKVHQSWTAKEWLIQVKTGIVSDTPNKPAEIDPAAIVLGTPQKIIDFEIERPYHFWLDVSSREWSRTDNAPLYNAWVHSAIWDGNADCASDAFNQRLTRTRAGHITRTLMLYVGKRAFLYASEMDDQGNPQAGQFHHMLRLPVSEPNAPIPRASLRDDQQAILTYRQGAMAITAVPGAGKTFVNVELLLELISQGVPPDRILVLTYMDSAARTLLSRLKNKLADRVLQLPVVSTIHSLAFRIIMEDDHAVYLGLDPDNTQIMDAVEEKELIQAVCARFDPDQSFFKNEDTVLQGIKLAKSYRLKPENILVLAGKRGIPGGQIIRFAHLYAAYVQAMRDQGKLDFTDLILHAIRLLEDFPEIRAKYRERFQYIVEDEAQDSSLLLQTFIELLRGENGNLIRTGDTNQSITTTFSTADTAVFREFIAQCESDGLVIRMTQSGRCAEPVMALANRFIEWAATDPILENAFLPVTMEAVPGHNPELLTPLMAQTFESGSMEQRWMTQRIHQLQRTHPECSIAILTRSNPEVLQISRVLQDAEIKAICYTELPDLNPVFLVITDVLGVLENPADMERIRTLLDRLNLLALLPLSEAEREQYCTNLFSLDPLTIQDGNVLQLYYNLQDLIRYSFGQDICRLIVRLTDLFFPDPQQRSIGYLCALKAQEWVEQVTQPEQYQLSPLEWVNKTFQEYIRRKKLPFKTVQEAGDMATHQGQLFVRVMTLHKSKGQEFDFVFIPGMHEKAFPSVPETIRWRDGDKLELEIEKLRTVTPEEAALLADRKKRQKLEEEARLVYVGLTRARKGLFLSCPLETSPYGRPERQNRSRYFAMLQDAVTPPGHPFESEPPIAVPAEPEPSLNPQSLNLQSEESLPHA